MVFMGGESTRKAGGMVNLRGFLRKLPGGASLCTKLV